MLTELYNSPKSSNRDLMDLIKSKSDSEGSSAPYNIKIVSKGNISSHYETAVNSRNLSPIENVARTTLRD